MGDGRAMTVEAPRRSRVRCSTSGRRSALARSVMRSSGPSSITVHGLTSGQAGWSVPTSSSSGCSTACRGGPSGARCMTGSSMSPAWSGSMRGGALPIPPSTPPNALLTCTMPLSWRALPHGGPLPLPRRPRQRRLARRSDWPQPDRGRHGRHRLRRLAASFDVAPERRRAGDAVRAGPRRPHRDGQSCQRTYEHAIPKTAKPAGPRISVQFRVRHTTRDSFIFMRRYVVAKRRISRGNATSVLCDTGACGTDSRALRSAPAARSCASRFSPITETLLHPS